MTSKTPGSSGVMNRISRDERTAPINTVDNGEIPQYMSLDECGPCRLTCICLIAGCLSGEKSRDSVTRRDVIVYDDLVIQCASGDAHTAIRYCSSGHRLIWYDVSRNIDLLLHIPTLHVTSYHVYDTLYDIYMDTT